MIKYIFKKPALSGRIARWQMILTEYDIQYTTQKAIKAVPLPVELEVPSLKIVQQCDPSKSAGEVISATKLAKA